MATGSSSPQTAEEQMLDAIDAMLAGNESALSIPYSALNQAISDVVVQNGKAIKRITEKVLREADKALV